MLILQGRSSAGPLRGVKQGWGGENKRFWR